ncbi:MAG TPA: YetF domain-containing protein [Anditalea sp.]|nr:YetF domain-containing protein [Anditalea sp.]
MILLDFTLSDWQRIILGELPPGILFEVILRTVVVYIILMVSMRLMGKRMASQLSRLELTAMISLAAAIGVPVLAPEQGLIPAIIIAAIVVFVQRFISSRNRYNKKFERFTVGDLSIMVKEGVFQKDLMDKALISNERLKAQMRSEKLVHSGEIFRLYLEADGSFSTIIADNPEPGLGLIPDFDEDFSHLMLEATDIKICGNCGLKASEDQETFKCKSCDHDRWTYAVKRKSQGN